MATETVKRILKGTLLPSSAPVGAQFTAANPHGLTWLHLYNSHSAAVTVTMRILPSGDTASAATDIVYTIDAGQQMPFQTVEILATGDKIFIWASVADKVRASISGWSYT